MTTTIVDTSGSVFFPIEIPPAISASAINNATLDLRAPVTIGATVNKMGPSLRPCLLRYVDSVPSVP